ncbi:CO(2)-response secreted protease-like [Macadamia integrifolia]|uniref:CO(2)-response secreted protease-like n=1 Tax=Macadamia integrifolia TaxID=60698 RepID=UPI001C4E5C3F|nr:CO(2)-response secreted protease-like [Macadamia integrifolia]
MQLSSPSMASPPKLIFFLSLSCLLILHGTTAKPQPYVIYMGSSSNYSNGESDTETEESAHLQLLSTIIPSKERERLSLIHSYHHSFKGFSAMLTEEEASALSGHEQIVSLFKDPILQLHTTRSWDFLDAESGVRSNYLQYPEGSEDVIIGVIDTGIWPESPSFNDDGIGEIPSRWRGVCMEGSNFKKSDCNRKLIGARYYNIRDFSDGPDHSGLNKTHGGRNSTGSPRDTVGHGTHTSSTAAGARVANASYYGLAQGTARGGSPSSRIAMYKACSLNGCFGATILKAIDDSIKDGVDIISISIGMSSLFPSDFLNDPISIGAFHANQMGIMVICSGGNDGPDPYTVVNAAPWIFTVAASNIDRQFQSTVVLGNGNSFQGFAINFSNLTRSKTYPLAFGGDVAAPSAPVSEASNCYPGSLDSKKVAGKIIVCTNTNPLDSRRIKTLVVEAAQGKGLILIDEEERGVALDSGVFPFSQVGDMAGHEILKYINYTKNPMATILPTVDVEKIRPAPVVAYFSSRGPGGLTENIIKPDVTAPGVGILAAMIPINDIGAAPVGKKPSDFALKSGTSMACPHVAGAAAFLKSLHHTWTPSMIKSALMTTATTFNNLRKPITNSSNGFASPHEIGAGEISPIKALSPGLVYETTPSDYLNFLCYYGYKEKIVRSMSGTTTFSCPNNSFEDLISNMNHPSISISKLERHLGVRTIVRTVTNVGPMNASYIAKVHSPSGLVVKVSPGKLVFTKSSTKASFKVSFYAKGSITGYRFGYFTWSNGVHLVRTIFAVNVV